MLHRKIYQLSRDGKDVWIYLKDQGRWLERARILEIEGDTVLVRYESEDEDEICSWEEMIRLDSIGAVAQRLSLFPKGPVYPADLPVAEECPEAEQLILPPPPEPEAEGETPRATEEPGNMPLPDPLLRLEYRAEDPKRGQDGTNEE